ncbi:response regulator transcription factor [Beggiatoa leptomitoformis]|uniref:Response regulator n=1 Tax=Beggiatoa leptomitoformis TaxID=288004 RepID=A0A2N9YID9_9GAMM|nr:response regulator [Beggiatoa leptomitoformis]ALG67490.1 response regulator [Beggiatoa leptomitoformis]AUI70288.1 response regulator [Beggiatoa leptomitoformis]
MIKTIEPRVFVVDDEPDVRAAIRLLLKTVGLKVEIFESAIEFLQKYQMEWAGCLIVDVRMPGMSGLELQAKLHEMRSPLALLVISGHGEVEMAVKAVKAGAIDFIQKPFSDQHLLDCVQEALQSGVSAYQRYAEETEITGRYNTLTAREKEVMWLVVEGKSNKLIGMDLNISVRTVEIHRARVMEKLMADTFPALMRVVAVVEKIKE